MNEWNEWWSRTIQCRSANEKKTNCSIVAIPGFIYVIDDDVRVCIDAAQMHIRWWVAYGKLASVYAKFVECTFNYALWMMMADDDKWLRHFRFFNFYFWYSYSSWWIDSSWSLHFFQYEYLNIYENSREHWFWQLNNIQCINFDFVLFYFYQHYKSKMAERRKIYCYE